MADQQVVVGPRQQILGEAAEIEVVRDQVVDGGNSAVGDGLAESGAALEAGDRLAPDFRGQGVVLGGGGVPGGAALAQRRGRVRLQAPGVPGAAGGPRPSDGVVM